MFPGQAQPRMQHPPGMLSQQQPGLGPSFRQQGLDTARGIAQGMRPQPGLSPWKQFGAMKQNFGQQMVQSPWGQQMYQQARPQIQNFFGRGMGRLGGNKFMGQLDQRFGYQPQQGPDINAPAQRMIEPNPEPIPAGWRPPMFQTGQGEPPAGWGSDFLRQERNLSRGGIGPQNPIDFLNRINNPNMPRVHGGM